MSQPPPPHDPGQQPPQGYGPQGFGPPGYGPGPAPWPVPVTSGKATAALVVGIITLVLSWCCGLGLLGLVAVVLGLQGRREVRASGGAVGGEGLALAGIITGAVAAVLGLLVLVLLVVAVATGGAQFTTDFNATGV